MPRDPTATREALVEAAFATLREEGFAGTTARAIAARANVNQALVFYHFGGVDNLLLAALDRSAADRLARYRAAMAAATTTAERIAAARRLYAEDVTGGHVTVITELLAASVARPELRAELVERMRPWLELVADVFREVAGDWALQELVPIEDAASAFVALYLGLNLLSRLDPEDTHAEALFAVMERIAPLFDV
jgi:AcrR family transcriptional regulator